MYNEVYMLAILCYTCMLPKYTFLNQTVQSRYESNVILVKFSLISEICHAFFCFFVRKTNMFLHGRIWHWYPDLKLKWQAKISGDIDKICFINKFLLHFLMKRKLKNTRKFHIIYSKPPFSFITIYYITTISIQFQHG